MIPVHARGADGGAGAGINRLETPGLSRGDNEIDGATAALRAHKASGPISDGKIGAIARGLFAGIDVDVAPAIVAPGPQQQIRFCRRAERCRPCGAFVALSPHGAPVILARDAPRPAVTVNVDSKVAPRARAPA